jgi:transcriptional regulator with XRE-family HTH domain
MTEIEFRRQQRGLSQYELASLIGRSQGQLANALRGHDPIAKASTGCLLWRVRLSIKKRE